MKPFHIRPDVRPVIRVHWAPIMKPVGEGGPVRQSVGDAEPAAPFQLSQNYDDLPKGTTRSVIKLGMYLVYFIFD